MPALNTITFKEQEAYTWFKKEKKESCFGKAIIQTAGRQASMNENQNPSNFRAV